MRLFKDRIAEMKPQLALMDTLDMGKPLPESEWDIDDVVTCFDYFATHAEALDAAATTGTAVDVGDADYSTRVVKQPVGVVAAITPWNYPALMATWKVAPALAAGCTVVLKPSENAVQSCLAMARIASTIFPPGVLNVITGAGDVGRMLTSHPGVDKISFTGSLASGRHVMTNAAKRVTNVTLELGGKSSAIVFQGSPLDRTAEWVLFGCMWTNGQICSATSRCLVQSSMYDDFVAKLVEEARKIVVGAPLAEGTKLGPLVTAHQRDKALDILRRATSADPDGVYQPARVLCGGGPPEDLSPDLAGGYYIAPTVLEVEPSNRLNPAWVEEIFAPVLTVMRFDDEAQAVAAANDTEYGLAGAVFTPDRDQAARAVAALDCGITWVNCSQPCFCQLPWGGRKQSGVGRDLGAEGLESYLQPKQVVEYVKDGPLDWYGFAA